MPVRERWALAALAGVAGVTAAWWLAALWPLPEAVPAWVVRARAACFGATASGLPDGGGWLLLVGQPLGMLGFLLVVWGSTVRAALRTVAASARGRAALAGAVGLVTVGAGLAGSRVSSATAAARPAGEAVGSLTVLDRPAPALHLMDQHGQAVALEHFRGRPVLVTFAYAHCETVCPLVVREVLALRRAAGERAVAIVVTLDPWRDVPARLPTVAAAWQLGPDEFVLSGSVDAVTRALDAWAVPRTRDPRTGDLVHPALTYLVDAAGVLRGRAIGAPDPLVALLDAR